MSYWEPIATPGSHLEPSDDGYCEDCDNNDDDCECTEYYVEEKDEY